MPILLLFFQASSLTAGNFYTWTDENGVKHFSDAPPPTGSPSEFDVYESETTESSPSPKKAECDISQLETLLSYTVRDLRAMSDKDLMHYTNELQKHCECIVNKGGDGNNAVLLERCEKQLNVTKCCLQGF